MTRACAIMSPLKTCAWLSKLETHFLYIIGSAINKVFSGSDTTNLVCKRVSCKVITHIEIWY